MATELLFGRLVLGLRTVLALLVGLTAVFIVVLAVFMPRTTTVLVVQLFAFYALLDGVLSIVAVRAVDRMVPRCFMVLEGVVSVGTGVAAFIAISGYGERPPQGLLTLIALWAIVTGALQLALTFSLNLRRGRGILAATAALSVALGISLLGWEPPDLMAAVWRLAMYALLLGVLRLTATVGLRRQERLDK